MRMRRLPASLIAAALPSSVQERYSVAPMESSATSRKASSMATSLALSVRITRPGSMHQRDRHLRQMQHFRRHRSEHEIGYGRMAARAHDDVFADELLRGIDDALGDIADQAVFL